jgi:hypothetical protein
VTKIEELVAAIEAYLGEEEIHRRPRSNVVIFRAIEALEELRASARLRDHLRNVLGECYDTSVKGPKMMCHSCLCFVTADSCRFGHDPNCVVGAAEDAFAASIYLSGSSFDRWLASSSDDPDADPDDTFEDRMRIAEEFLRDLADDQGPEGGES